MGLPTTYSQVLANQLTGKQSKEADLGNYFICKTPTTGTGIAGVTSLTTYTAASPVLIVYNSNVATSTSSGNIWLDYASLFVTATAASTTSLVLVGVMDTGNRYSSAGSGGSGTNVSTALIGPFATNLNVAGNGGALVYAGALVASGATANVRIIGSRLIRQQIPVVLDQYIVNFGACDATATGLPPSALSAAVPATSTVAMPPVCIVPGSSFLLYYYGASMGAAPSFEVEVGFVLGQ
jgi:hypothetical protein